MGILQTVQTAANKAFPVLLALTAALCGGCATPARKAPAGPAPGDALRIEPFELEDQFDRLHSYGGGGDRPVVLIAGGPDAAASNTEWDRRVTARYGDRLEIFRIVRLDSVPRLFEPFVVSRIKAEADPPDAAVLLDWEGRIFAMLGLGGDLTNLVLADAGGAVRLVLTGPPDPVLEERLFQGIDILLEGNNEK